MANRTPAADKSLNYRLAAELRERGGDGRFVRSRDTETCQESGCDRAYYAKGMCQLHWRRNRSGYVPQTFAEKFWAKVDKSGSCWIWQGHLCRGYGTYNHAPDFVPRPAHRIAYELVRGSIPEGLVIDHICRNPPCVNPDHLEPVTNRENILRGIAPSAINKRKTHCVHGHEFTPENTYLRPDNGNRQCRTCARARKQRRRDDDYWNEGDVA